MLGNKRLQILSRKSTHITFSSQYKTITTAITEHHSSPCCLSSQLANKSEYINIVNVQNQISTVILSFGAADAVGANGLPADLATFASMGCYGLGVTTSIMLGDTAEFDELHVLEPELVNEQARTVLEDITVNALKIGQIGSIENAAVIAEISADYPDQHLILDPFPLTGSAAETDDEDLLLAIRELLIPQASLICLSSLDLSRLAETWSEENTDHELATVSISAQDETQSHAQHLLSLGCEYVLVTNLPAEQGQFANCLYHQSGMLCRDTWDRVPGQHLGAGTTLSAAICALMANGMEIQEAVKEAQEYTQACLQHAERLGMGKLLPNRFFWAIPAANTDEKQPED